MHETYKGPLHIEGCTFVDCNAGDGDDPPMLGTHTHVTGARPENGRMIGGRVTYSSDWPADARKEVAHLTRALQAIADGEGNAQEIARQALDADGTGSTILE